MRKKTQIWSCGFCSHCEEGWRMSHSVHEAETSILPLRILTDRKGHTTSKPWTLYFDSWLSDSKAHTILNKLCCFCVYTNAQVWVNSIRDKSKAIKVKALLTWKRLYLLRINFCTVLWSGANFIIVVVGAEQLVVYADNWQCHYCRILSAEASPKAGPDSWVRILPLESSYCKISLCRVWIQGTWAIVVIFVPHLLQLQSVK